MDTTSVIQTIKGFIKRKVGDKTAFLGLSGGIDSAVVAFLAAQALGKEKIHGVIMPSSINSPKDIEDASKIAEILEIKCETVNIEDIVASFQKNLVVLEDKVTLGNLKARIRMCILYALANESNGLVLGTGNKSEIMVGYFTKYGDGGCDLLPLGDLYKTEVYEIARALDMPEHIISKPPSAGLWENQTDEQELGIPYPELDVILSAIESDGDLSNFDLNMVKKVQALVNNSEHKRILPFICKI